MGRACLSCRVGQGARNPQLRRFMLYRLAEYEHLWGPLRLFRYLTFRSFLAMLTALLVTFVVAPILFRWLRQKKLEQVFREKSEVRELADLHASKKHTPTMGGLAIFAGVVVSTLLWTDFNVYVGCSLFVYAYLTLMGFADDYLKVFKKNTKGLPGYLKLILQAVLCFIVLWMLFGNASSVVEMGQIWVPFLKAPVLINASIGLLFAFLFLILAGSSNAINLTDGIDGLAIGCTIAAALTYAIFAYIAGNVIIANYLSVGYVPGAGELTIICVSLVGSGLAFLWYNAHPAEVFMGDTGSLALGGLIGIIAFLVQQPLTLILVGGVFVMEAVSVILQVGSFKLTHKRIFKMAPIHHHFELKGLSEIKVVIRFWILALLFALIGLATLKLH